MKNLLIILSLVITASPAFASRARLESLGENANGSYYINDSRDIFLNPAAISMYKKKMFFEMGTSGAAVDAFNAPKAEGGFTNTFGDFTYGLYLGKTSNRALAGVAQANTFGAAVTAPDHAFDFFFGGENGVKWGADVFYAGAYDKVNSASINTASMLGIRLGATINNNINVFTTLGLTNDEKHDTTVATSTNEIKGKLSVDLGATYSMDDMTYLAKFTSFGSDVTLGGATVTTVSTATTAFGLGAGWKHEASKSVTVYSRVQADMQKDTVTSATAGPAANTTHSMYNIPVILAAEAQATSWLTFRASISHSLIGQTVLTTNEIKSLDGLTAVAMGFGLNFGDLTIDGLAGQSVATAGSMTESSQGTAQSGNLAGLGDQLMGRLALTYNF